MGCRLKENPDELFIAFFEVAAPADKSSAAKILYQYPADFNDIGVTKELPKFCFPCDLSMYNPAGQLFTFVLTGLDNKQRFGFCRLPPGALKCLCILSYLPWFEIFYKILNQIAELKHSDHIEVSRKLIAQLYSATVPSVGIQFSVSIQGDTDVEVAFIGPDVNALPRIPENRNITEYFSAINHTNMMILFASLLYERRILITSEKLSRLTACVHGAASLLYPLYWQHIYIPVMPAHLIDYCCAPMPFLVGVHSSFMPQVKKMALDEVVILNADTNSIETPFDDLSTLPPEAVSQLKKNLKNTALFIGDGVARSFLKMLVYILAGYREAIRIKSGNSLMFDNEIFVQCRSHNMQPFLENLLQLQHFTQFVDAKVDLIGSGKPVQDLFEDELEIAKQDGSLSSKKLKETLKMHLSTVRTDSKKIFKDVHKSVHQKANPEAMKEMLRQTRDFASKQYIGMKTKLIKGKETEDIEYMRKASHRGMTYLDISLPMPSSSAPTSPACSPDTSPLPHRAMSDVRKKPLRKDYFAVSHRPLTVAGIPNKKLVRSAESNSSSKTLGYKMILQENEEDLKGASRVNNGSPTLIGDLKSALLKIETEHGLEPSVTHDKKTDDVPVPKPRRKRITKDGKSPSEGSLPPPPLIPPRRERRSSAERLIDIPESDSKGRTSVQNALGVDCEDTTLAFHAVQTNNNAQWGSSSSAYPQPDVATSAQTLLADYGLYFDAPQLTVPGLRAIRSSPDLQTCNPPPPTQQLLVQQPPASTLPDLLNPTTSLPRQTVVSFPPLSPLVGGKSPPQGNPFQQAVPLQPVVATENPFSPPPVQVKDPFDDLVSFQGGKQTSWKK